MIEAFRFCPEAVANTVKIAEQVDLDLKFGENKIPFFPTAIKIHMNILGNFVKTVFIKDMAITLQI